MNDSTLIETLTRSQIYRDYERAFSEATGLPLSLRPVQSWQVPHSGKKNENAFCHEMASHNRSCAACLTTQEKLADGAHEEACTILCELGMMDTSVPVKLGDQLIGFLQTGQIFCKKPTARHFASVAKKLSHWGLTPDAKIEKAYFATPVMPQKHYDSMIQLLTIFSQHLSLVSNEIALAESSPEPVMVTRAKSFITVHQNDALSLTQVARAVNTSTFYFCKMFKKATGLSFTAYLSRVRIQKSKALLLNPNLRINEIAFAVGFQSVTHFNRVFKKLMGESPGDYRRHAHRS